MVLEDRWRVTFVGVGEAFDEALGNTSVLVSTPSPASGGQILLEMATTCNAKALALVHVNRDVRREHAESIRSRLSTLDGVRAFLPEPGDQLEI